MWILDMISPVFIRLRGMLWRALKGICRCLKEAFHRIKAIFHLSKPRKTAGPLLPIENPTDHQYLVISSSESDSQCQSSQVFSADQCLDPPTIIPENVVSVTISIPSAKDTDTATVVQENVTQKNGYTCADKLEDTGICYLSVEKNKCQGKESEGEKVIESNVVVLEQARWIKHYSSRHRILLVGEGDFSFSSSLAEAFGCASRMIATSLDSKGIISFTWLLYISVTSSIVIFRLFTHERYAAFLKKNYANAPWNIRELKRRGCMVMHGIDATTIAADQLLGHMTFDRIIYNFPFAGFFKGLSRDSVLRRHRRLVSLFLKNAKELLDEEGEIHISHKTNEHHSEWKLVSIASSHGLRLIEEVEFVLSDYPGYNTKRGFGGDGNFHCYPSSTFKFGLKRVVG
ncbi:hypothetical protein F511_14243 [Dorcoceras hygrometricum]|uniref:25S rRNA (uridine-N(3))-methyltransferase BMT5-like domain-containing protein n=1 Tax=Dorcoceras hygrometricum TaxID=472368 RepID=A0A2Z7BVY9_9LAMI|nr:hypothetical protein F511_14243 [Dorcoceras hygrometricum]